ncbi:MAG: microcin ABC transporter ATP-binding protein [Tagaea sp. CACIAM 22H2]|nr:microcin ABC transporter ATP-binding protein [Tagaea sp. CACIAM 22H2]
MAPVLAIRDLDIRFRTGAGELHAVKRVSFAIEKGETLAIVGESGSGKSQTMLAALGLLAANGGVTGSAKLNGIELVGASQSALDELRGRKVAMIFQEPMTSLDPLYTIGAQLVKVLRRHKPISRVAAREEAAALLDRVRIPDAAARLDSYPHEMSGGQRQRVMIAMALAHGPDLLVADEPTTALDVTIQAEILELLGALQRELGMAIAFITHDLGLVRRFAKRVIVMRGGEIVEHGAVADIFSMPKHDYTKALLDAEPAGRKAPVAADAPIVLTADDIRVEYEILRGMFGRRTLMVKAVDGVSIALRAGETLGLVGESGSGKSTLARSIVRLAPATGLVRFEDRALLPLSKSEIRPIRKTLQMVFQDPYGSLSPRMSVGEIVSEGLRVHEPGLTASQRDARAASALEEVRLDPEMRRRFPHEFSGGQRQRIAIARAIVLRPKLVILDEPTSALDRTIQKAIVELLRDLQARHGLAYLFVSHDLATVRAMADRIAVMKDGKIVEEGETESLLANPRADYTRRLLAAAFTGKVERVKGIEPSS